ncbi:hypothetical protein FOL47_010398 [Perkinsus chesapeaki]|uniref:C3H1-type domain-containing protein n=1 Tax=Perkinsus chesapeaki TaxID=330153 RepID=A0A7J6MRI8_PERCH|nr:hypothetical protein FOL47_010398 [Perkinsus chesapeaki]
MSHTMSPSYGGSCGTFDDTEVGLADVSKEWSGIKKRMYKTQVCKYYIRGRCLHGPLCAFAHSVDELNMKPDLTKTKLCIKPGCSNPKCSFAHTLDELRLAVGTKDTFIDAYDANITPSNAVGQTSDPYSAYFENQYRILSSGRGSTNLGLLPNPPTSSALPPPRKGGVQGPIEGRRRNSAPVVQDDSTSSKFEGGFSTPSTTSGSTNDDIQDLLQCLRLFSSGLSVTERMIFDSCGFIVLRNILSDDQIFKVNGLFDKYSSHFVTRGTAVTTAHSDFFKGDSGRSDYGKILQVWTQEWPQFCTALLQHPRLIDVIEQLCGEGFRLDHRPLAFQQCAGGEGFDLHGGRLLPCGDINHPVQYTSVDNTSIRCSLITVSFAITDMPQGAGGFVALPGSHKASFPITPEICHAVDPAIRDMLVQPAMKAGDVVLFSEALLHGTLPWMGPHTRRTILLRYAPATCAYARGYTDTTEVEALNLPEAVKEMLKPPFHPRFNRVDERRSPEQLEYEECVFGAPYY